MRITIKHRGQITIPAKLRKQLLLQPGDLLEVEVKGGALVCTPLEVLVRREEAGEEARAESSS
jgi:AbrB family looped-hinge helix DNA binding protein